VGTIFAALLVWQLAIPRPYYTGTNSVGVRSVVANLNLGQRLCVPDLNLPAGTGRVQLALFAHRASFAAKVSVTAAGTTTSSEMTGVPGPTSLAFPQAAIPVRPSSPSSVAATVCVTPLDGPIAVGGMVGLPANQVPAALNGAPVASRVAVWFLPRAGQERSLLDSLGAIFTRAALFRPGVVGAWTYPVLLFVVLPLLFLVSLLLLARSAADRPLLLVGRSLRPGAVVAAIAFVNAASWALITPAFNAPDEPDHFAYAQYLATTGHAPPHSGNVRPAFSTDETVALDAVNLYSQVALPEARPPWLALEQRNWERGRAAVSHPADNGGGTTPGASQHQPAYYALLVPAYEAVRSQSPFSQLTAMRLVSALLGALVAFCAFGIVREILPRQRVAAVAAGLLVAFHPMFGFISGAVNNDNGINAAAALSLYLLVRGLRRGLTWRLALALAATLAVAPLMKETGYEIYPAAAVGLMGIVWRQYRRRDLRSLAAPAAAFIAAFAVVSGGWSLLQVVFYPSSSGHSTAAGGISAASALSLAEQYPTRFLVYMWELFLPRLPFMGAHFPPGWPFKSVYVIRGWGAFGWYVWEFPNWVYDVIIVAMGTVGLLALTTALRWRLATRARAFELAVIALFPVCTLLAVEAAFFEPADSRTVVAEQGRYIFPAISALAAIAIAGTFGLGRRWHVPLATTLVVAVIGLSYASQWLTLGSFFT
jgi:4-amino-4-deoxy-L-arabinose transferase-like glycosyltransferase